MRRVCSASDVRVFLDHLEDIELQRFYFCYQIGSTFVNLSLMEDSLINTMSICDRVKVGRALGDDAKKWEELIQKRDALQSSTLGNLIGILSRHGATKEDVAYLKWVKERRDYFVHRFFQRGCWPGDLFEDDVEVLFRELLYLEHVFRRMTQRAWKIFARANLMDYQDLGDAGVLLINPDMFLEDEDDSAQHDFRT